MRHRMRASWRQRQRQFSGSSLTSVLLKRSSRHGPQRVGRLVLCFSQQSHWTRVLTRSSTHSCLSIVKGIFGSFLKGFLENTSPHMPKTRFNFKTRKSRNLDHAQRAGSLKQAAAHGTEAAGSLHATSHGSIEQTIHRCRARCRHRCPRHQDNDT